VARWLMRRKNYRIRRYGERMEYKVNFVDVRVVVENYFIEKIFKFITQ
jgi:hypothetical protein